ncbi:hypothetical protein STEG23_000478, partial [Scotinomys teguina]
MAERGLEPSPAAVVALPPEVQAVVGPKDRESLRTTGENFLCVCVLLQALVIDELRCSEQMLSDGAVSNICTTEQNRPCEV